MRYSDRVGLDHDDEERRWQPGRGEGHVGPQGSALILELRRLQAALAQGDDEPRRPSPNDDRPDHKRAARPAARAPVETRKARKPRKGVARRALDRCLENLWFGNRTSTDPPRLSATTAHRAAPTDATRSTRHDRTNDPPRSHRYEPPARADESGSGRVSGARTIESPRWPLASLASAARADEPGSGRVSSARLRASSDALCARTIESPRWPLASLASAAAAAPTLAAVNGNGAHKEPLLVVEKLIKEYPRKGIPNTLSKLFKQGPAPEPEIFRAVDGISFTVDRGESVGLVGESGCGKSTTSTMVMRLIDKSDGTIMFDGENIGEIPAKRFAKLPLRKRIQMVFQDPTDSLNPRFTAARAIADPILRLGGLKGNGAVRARCEELARQVGLPLDLLDRFPHQLSGGQKARVGIARAIALNPDLVILDEPTAALDVSVQAVVLNLLQELKDSLGMSYLFVSHDLNVVRLLCDRVIVMRAGKVVEQGPTDRVLFAPEADYTRELLAAIPHPTFEQHA